MDSSYESMMHSAQERAEAWKQLALNTRKVLYARVEELGEACGIIDGFGIKTNFTKRVLASICEGKVVIPDAIADECRKIDAEEA